jgi:hypothetical protein
MENDCNYPSSIDEVLDDTITYRKSLIKLMKQYKKYGPWEGKTVEKAAKLYWLHMNLCKIYGANVTISFDPSILLGNETKNGNGWYSPVNSHIHISGKVSVLTFLHEWGHALHGPSERLACWWSINLFRKIFPENYKRLYRRANGHLLSA